MNKQKVIGAVVTASVGVFVLCGGLTLFQNTKNEEEATVIAADENDSREYALISVSKDNFHFESEDFDGHAFIESVSSALSESLSEGKIYTTFVFDDGTGVYFPFSDITKSAKYGIVNEEGLITETYGYITVSGTQVTYEEVPEAVSKESISLYDYVENEYLSDDFGILKSGDALYVSLASESRSEEDAMAYAVAFTESLKTNGLDISNITEVYVNIGDMFGFIVDPNNTQSVTSDTSVIDTVNDKF